VAPAPPGGLTEAEARARLAAAGDRPPPPTSRSYKSIVRENTLTLFNLILGVALVAILIAGRPADGLFALVLVGNAGIGIIQEIRAKQALDAAALLVAPKARVIRDGAEREVGVDDVVKDDLIALRVGDQVVADGVVAEAVGLQLDESPLTGESLPVTREPGDRLLSGSFCVEGAGRYVAELTGTESYASRLLGEARRHNAQRSPLEIQMNRLLKVLVLVMIPLGTGLIIQLQRHHVPFQEAAGTAVAGIVTLVPEGLILLTSLTFAVAAVRLTRRGMLVQYLNSVESLANVDTVCLDKTGTLTDGGLVLHSVEPVASATEDEVRTLLGRYAGAAASRNATLDAVATALPVTAVKALEEVPFSSRWKWSALRQSEGDWLVLGAPDVLAPNDLAGASEHESAGRRVLAFGRAENVEPPVNGTAPATPHIQPLALVVLEERLRSDARDTLAYFEQRAVSLKVMSGDSPTTVAAIAEAAGVGAGAKVWDGRDLPSDPVDLARAARNGTVFARLTPDQKRALIDALNESGAYVAMIGDGVNDVPAMKSARLAVALGSGSQLAKSVADAVLVTDRFGAIPEAIGEGRKIIRNVQRVAKLFVTKSVFAAFVIVTFGITTAAFPLLPRHLTLAATFTVGIPGFVLALAPGEAPPEQGKFLRRVAAFSIPAGVVLGATTLAAYLAVAHVRNYSVDGGRTAAVTVFIAIGLYLLLALESDRMQQSRGYASTVVALAAALGGGYLAVLGSSLGREFFALTVPNVWETIVIVVTSVAGMWILSRVGLSPYAKPQPPPLLPPGTEAKS
jgi:magnesium-transporting ATPase (P-type)